MAMDKINGSPLLQSGILDRFQGTKSDKSKSTEETGTAASQSAPAPTTDKAEISETAHKLIDLRQAVDVGRAAIGDLPDLRQEKIALAKQRMSEGYYESDEVQQQVAEKLGSVLASMDDI